MGLGDARVGFVSGVPGCPLPQSYEICSVIDGVSDTMNCVSDLPFSILKKNL